MPLDALDQETVNKLPRLSQLHAAYGVQVNKIGVDELFDLYERTGFLYPEKARRLLPHMDSVKENWRRMLRAEESLLYILVAGDAQRGRATMAVWRSARHGWTYQHLVSESNPYASRAVMLAAEAESILKGSDESSQNWFRPENRFPARVFGSMIQSIGGSFSSSQQHAYFELPRRMSLREDPEFRVVSYDPSRNKDLCSMAVLSRGHVYVAAEELAGDVPFKSLDGLYHRVGLRRTRHAYLAYRKGKEQLVGAVVVYRGPLGLNFSYLETRCDLLLPPNLSASEMERVTNSLLSAATAAYDDFELDAIPVIASEEAGAAVGKAGGQFIRHYCQCIWLKDGRPRGYRHVDSFYSKVLTRAGKNSLNSLVLQETR